MRHDPSKQCGMTIIEVMVALFVVAISLLAASSAFSQWVYGSQQLHEQMLANVCAQNTLTAWMLGAEAPAVGKNTQACEQDGLVMHVHTEVSATRNDKFRRAQLRVTGPSHEDVDLVTITTVVGKI